MSRLSAGTWRRAGLEERGTRFLLYPQAPLSPDARPPEVVLVSPPAGTVGPGPADARMYVADAVRKALPYEPPEGPPYRGARRRPVAPGPGGHFDHLAPGSHAFMAAHMYGTIRFVLDVWERYLGGAIPWHFAADFERLELVPVVEWDNAQCGYGFIETGFAPLDAGRGHAFCLDFDVLAHEIGHAFIYSLLGLPPPEGVTAEFLAFHESAADCTAMIAVLHFDSVVDDLLRASRGNIYLPNELNRIGELSDTDQLRVASNSLRMSDVPGVRLPVEMLDQHDRHTIGLPLTGGVFDLLVEVFQSFLVGEGLIGGDLDGVAHKGEESDAAEVQAAFDRAYAGRHDAFKSALLDARDYVGRLLAGSWRRLGWDVSFEGVAAAMIDADAKLTGGAGRDLVITNLAWREIRPGVGVGQRAYGERLAAARARRW